MQSVRRLVIPSLLLAFAWMVAPAQAGDAPKVARGIVTAIGANSIMINLPSDTDVTFRIDNNTTVVARGAGRKMREAQANGVSGVKLTDVLPIGQTVTVSYEERNGLRYASRIVTVAAIGR